MTPPRHVQPVHAAATGPAPAAAGRALAPPRAEPQLFRQEVLARRQTQWLGPVLLAPRASHRVFTLLAAVALAAVLALLFFAHFTRTARVNGWLLPQEGMVRVIAPRPGVVSNLHVKEGAQVARGEPLLTLSDELQSSSLGATQGQVMRGMAERRESLRDESRQQKRLLAQQTRAYADRIAALRNEEAQIEREIRLLKSRVAIAGRSEALHREQFQSGFISDMRLQLAESESLEQGARLGALERNRLTAIRERRSVEAERDDLPLKFAKEFSTLKRNISQIDQDRAEAEARREIVVAAPQDGVVTAIHAVLGARADAATPLLSIVGADTPLEAHLYSPSRAVGFVRPGQHVRLRYQAYPYQRFGHYDGVVVSVSRTALSPGDLPPALASLTSLTGLSAGAGAEPLYRITVALASQAVMAYGAPVALQPGMVLEADVALERRRLYEWVLDPLYAVTGRPG